MDTMTNGINKTNSSSYYEYCSQTKFLGLPLIHVKIRRKIRLQKPGVAKGIIAIGDISVGIISLGGIALGILSLGGISVGLLALGGLALGAAALGGLAVGILALGGLAIGWSAIGGYAVGNIAIGGIANGTVAVGGRATGDFVISGTSEGPRYSLSHVDASKHEIRQLIKAAYPHLSEWLLRILTAGFK